MSTIDMCIFLWIAKCDVFFFLQILTLNKNSVRPHINRIFLNILFLVTSMLKQQDNEEGKEE